ncbi:3-dehydroquinate synthase II [Nanoarchaeota archaeon]
MKKFWVNIEQWDKNIVTTALESSADAVKVPKGFTEKVKELGKIATIAEDGDLQLGKDVIEITINTKDDENKAAKLGKDKIIIIKTSDWTVIPLENLIAQNAKIVAEVTNAKDAQTALETLEKGVDGILLNTKDMSEIKKVANIVKTPNENIQLVKVKITKTEQLGSGDRVCIDTCTNMNMGEGMLIGNSSSGMFLVHSESVENPYVAQRPFRVNAGAVHAYIKMPGDKTKYLSEIATGENVLIVNSKGKTQLAVVGRSKVEKRPLMLIEAEVKGKKISLVLQNAETIRLVNSDGKPISVVKLKPGDEVMAYVEEAGRHFGMKVEETIVEK